MLDKSFVGRGVDKLSEANRWNFMPIPKDREYDNTRSAKANRHDVRSIMKLLSLLKTQKPPIILG